MPLRDCWEEPVVQWDAAPDYRTLHAGTEDMTARPYFLNIFNYTFPACSPGEVENFFTVTVTGSVCLCCVIYSFCEDLLNTYYMAGPRQTCGCQIGE